MTSIADYTCQDVYGAVPPVANSNDPYVYVDPWTDRIMKFDMHALGGMTVEWSDDEGQSWTGPSIATGYSVHRSPNNCFLTHMEDCCTKPCGFFASTETIQPALFSQSRWWFHGGLSFPELRLTVRVVDYQHT